jgi:protein tyrosine/serine phosphatase
MTLVRWLEREAIMLRRFERFGAIYVALVVIAGLFTIANATFPPNLPATPGVSIENFGKVNEHYYRGSQPDQEQFAQLRKLGIKTVIDLRKDSKKAARDWVQKLDMKYFGIPLKAGTPATVEQTNYFLSLVNDPANWPVYVHCKGGRPRTGAMTALYRITHDGWTADQAWEEMKQYDFNNGMFGGPGAQKKFVYSFYQKFLATSKAAKTN